MYIHVPTHQDDRRNDRLAKQAMDTLKILGASGASHGWKVKMLRLDMWEIEPKQWLLF